MYLTSACLCGFLCRYDGKINPDSRVLGLFRKGLCVPVCPEILGGLRVPRAPAEIVSGSGELVLAGQSKVLSQAGEDVTEFFLRGAWRALEIGLQSGCREAILKSRSPSCGLGAIYDGSFSRSLKAGNGVLAALLIRFGFVVHSSDDLECCHDSLSTGTL